ncbi:uncharacterized protein LOC117326876 isoform X2 [Pecten maximus]|uniref:uncharacterized protein LOC117326876 isoform X2 n=1 Tax=Pecten maximus TaxID=6579 RepID=UPI0014587D00|nr:uncharacterized protein LOC117326876 isoform X2 [Pecten maximus]
MATFECWQPYTTLDQLLPSSLVLTDGEEVEGVKEEVPKSTRRAIKFIRNQKLRPKAGFRRRETWLENQLSLSSGVDILYHNQVKKDNRTTLRSQSSHSPRPSTEHKKRWIGLDLLLDPNINGSSKRPVKEQPSETVVYKRKNMDRSVSCLKQPYEPIPVFSRSPRQSSRIKRLDDTDTYMYKSFDDLDISENSCEGSKGKGPGGVSKPKNYTEILHYVDGTTSMGAIDTFEPIYVISRKTKHSYPASKKRNHSTYTCPRLVLSKSSSGRNTPDAQDTWYPKGENP